MFMRKKRHGHGVRKGRIRKILSKESFLSLKRQKPVLSLSLFLLRIHNESTCLFQTELSTRSYISLGLLRAVMCLISLLVLNLRILYRV